MGKSRTKQNKVKVLPSSIHRVIFSIFCADITIVLESVRGDYLSHNLNKCIFAKLLSSTFAMSFVKKLLAVGTLTSAVPLDSAPRSQSGTIEDMKHIVIFMQENRPFDHYCTNPHPYFPFGPFLDSRFIYLFACLRNLLFRRVLEWGSGL